MLVKHSWNDRYFTLIWVCLIFFFWPFGHIPQNALTMNFVIGWFFSLIIIIFNVWLIFLCFRVKYTTGYAVWPFSWGEMFVDDFRVCLKCMLIDYSICFHSFSRNYYMGTPFLYTNLDSWNPFIYKVRLMKISLR